ncbi:chemotaxis protein CheA [Rhizorhabdus dicambivorans]|uniref:Chemotaxis protein CheA n=1 Tax=Rhizorhabdus dicambivorans TaxID=1850238 RepID=A0A2A4G309_9SPHN|nr:chemotaxis protein CheA [Rhizorhabdus dicambivorans]ATE67289.1 chemotaxis protein CheA [Rhizorhabdus dicambivorans]PCE44190.1 chemotaxis protein CheA [Rhizorhabdus dicambivorans]
MDDLLGDFVAETRETLEALSGEIVAWELAPDDRSRLDAIFRFVHTVKGSCGFLDLPRLEKLSHAAEDVLADCRGDRRRPDAALVSAVLGVIDRIAELTDAIESGAFISEADDVALIAALQPQADAPAAAPEPEAAPEPAPAPVASEADILAEALAAIAEVGEISIEEIDEAEPAIEPETAVAAPVAAPAAKAPATPSTGAQTPRAVARTIRLPVDLLDRMMAGVSDMVLARNELARRLREGGADSATDVSFERLSQCIAEMRDAITRTRMARVENLFTALPRMVRDISAELGKQVMLEVDGGDVELDREMIEMIRDPLTHIVRNAIDHGIETPEARAAAGKPVAGRLHVSARQVGNQILIEVIDDGRGIDADRLVAKAISAGILSQERAATLNWDRKLELIFEPGLSTAQAVTAISGRGVGMDVVRANVERIGGLVDIESRPGQGLRLTLRVPLTLTIIPALTISSGGQHFAIPRSAIDEIVRIGGEAVRMGELGGARIVFIRGSRLPVVSLNNVIGLVDQGEQTNLVVLKLSGGARYALAVDAVHDHEELVVKPAAPVVMACGIYGGTTLPDNSRPMLLLDVAGVAEKAGVRREEKAEAAAEDQEEERQESGAVPVLLFRDLDGIERGIPLALVERIEDCYAGSISNSAGRARLNIEGRLVPLVSCGAPIIEAKVRVLRMRDGLEELAYAIDSVIDIVPVSIQLQRSMIPGPVAGVMLVEERPVEFLDAFWLFAQGLGAEAKAEQRPVCLLSDEDPWTRQVLAPLVESAGYAVIYSEEEGAAAADLVIMADSSDHPAEVGAGAVLRLRQGMEERGGSPGSLWRYDRIGLAEELRRHWNKRSA